MAVSRDLVGSEVLLTATGQHSYFPLTQHGGNLPVADGSRVKAMHWPNMPLRMSQSPRHTQQFSHSGCLHVGMFGNARTMPVNVARSFTVVIVSGFAWRLKRGKSKTEL